MRVIVLVENTSISKDYKSKHGLCLYIETKKHKLLFDLGSNSLFLENAVKLGVNITDIDSVIISHGHNDHGGALKYFLENNAKANIYISRYAFEEYYANFLGMKWNVGLDRKLKDHPRIILIEDEYVIDEELQIFSNIEEHLYLPTANNSLFVKQNGTYEHDTFKHEQYLIISESNYKTLFSGCAHNGIVNILNRAGDIAKQEMKYCISGFHLYDPLKKRTENINLIKDIANTFLCRNTTFYTCHCTGEEAYGILKGIADENKLYQYRTNNTVIRHSDLFFNSINIIHHGFFRINKKALFRKKLYFPRSRERKVGLYS